jgi:hypothetical protein
MYASQAKRHFYMENLVFPLLPSEKYNILLTALVEFDSQIDRELIRESIIFEDGMNIDGVYNFSFSKIKQRWKDIGELTKENSVFLLDNEIFFELIRYLFSAISPKIDSVQLGFDGKKYTILNCKNGEKIAEAQNDEELLCMLISTAPAALELKSGLISKTTSEKLGIIFGVDNEKSQYLN